MCERRRVVGHSTHRTTEVIEVRQGQGRGLSLRPRNHVVHHRGGYLVEVVGFRVGVDAFGKQRVEHRLQRRVGHRRKHVDRRLQRSYRRNDSLTRLSRARVTRSDDGDFLTVDRLGEKRGGWRVPIEQYGRQFIRKVLHIVEVEVRNLLRPVPQEERGAGEDQWPNWVQSVFERRHDAEVASTPTEGPE